jgi:hypothetical protein
MIFLLIINFYLYFLQDKKDWHLNMLNSNIGYINCLIFYKKDMNDYCYVDNLNTDRIPILMRENMNKFVNDHGNEIMYYISENNPLALKINDINNINNYLKI